MSGHKKEPDRIFAGHKKGPRRPEAKAALPAVIPLSDGEKALVVAYEQRVGGNSALPAFIDVATDDGKSLGFNTSKGFAIVKAQIVAVTGAMSYEAGCKLIDQLSNACVSPNAESPSAALLGFLSQVRDLGPRDPVESMIAVQMVAIHDAAMRVLALLNKGPVSTETATYATNQSARLIRLFMLQLEALEKYRGKGPSEQRVTVEHVHVHDGGQAVVGNVTSRGGGGANNASL